MADRFFRWSGNGAGTKSDYNDGRNWTNLAGTPYTQGVFPGTGAEDHVLFDTPLVAGALGCTTNCDRSADTPLLTLRVTSAYRLSTGVGTGDIGTVANSLKIDVSDSVQIDGSYCGNIYLSDGGTALSNVSVQGSYTGKAINLSGTIAGLIPLGGTINIADAATISTMLHIGSASLSTGVTLSIGSGVTLPTVISIVGGTVVCESAVGTLIFVNGTWDQQNDLTSLFQSGGTLNWTDGDITDAYVSGGKIDGTVSVNERAITRGHVSGSGDILLDPSITIGEWIEKLDNTGSFTPAAGQRFITA